jgi:cytochrome c oxidase subunit 2
MTFGVDMKRIGWAIALAAAFLTPAAASAQAQPAAAAPQAAAAPASEQPAAGLNQMAADPNGTGGPAQAATPAFHYTAPSNEAGEPIAGGWSPQVQVTEVGRQAAHFHNIWLLGLCAIISALVLILLATAIVRFRRGANPTPSRTSHNTAIEVIWTVIPVLILVAIAVPSIRLMRTQYSNPKADLTVKVIGNQWYWTYQYPDNGGLELVSNILKEKNDPTLKPGDRFRTEADGPPLLAVDERLVIPAGQVVKFLVTSNDVIHSFAMPAMWTKIDANPGQINETWVKVDRPGVYFGQCSELCGARHGFMPIAIDVVPKEQFAAWIHSKGGSMPGETPAPTPAALTTGSAAPAAAAPEAPATPAAAQPAAPTPSAANRATNNG